MKKYIIALSLLSLAACTKSSSSAPSSSSATDTAFTGSYFQYSYSGNYADAKAFPINSSNVYLDITTNLINISVSDYYILVQDPYQLYGTDGCQLHFLYNGSGTGTYPMLTLTNGTEISSFISASLQYYYDTTGTVTVTHSGTDYIQGTFSGTLYGSGLSTPVTGSFKVIH